MIQNESRDANGSNVRLFKAATCTSQCKLRSLRAHARLSALLYRPLSRRLDRCDRVIQDEVGAPSCTNYWRKHWSAELQGAAVTCYIPTGRCHGEWDTMLWSKFRLQIKTGPNHCNLIIFFCFSRNLEHCRVPHSSWRRPK